MSDFRWISAEAFLKRAETVPERSRRKACYVKPTGKTVDRLFVGSCETKASVVELIDKLRSFRCEAAFCDNHGQPSYSPCLKVTGEDRDLLRVLAWLANRCNASPDEITLYKNNLVL
ncbi:MAG: hypothetical protein ACYTEO_19620, partial [Planctomycetota bacterium]